MELTRLKRYIRECSQLPMFAQALGLLDVLDQVREAAEEYEDCLRQGDAPTERGMDNFVSEATDQLLEALVAMPSVGLPGLLSWLFDEVGYEQLLAEVETCKQRGKKLAERQDEEFGDLDDDSFLRKDCI